MDFSLIEPWHLFLPREGGHVVSLMGSGGKTSLLKAFARVYADENRPVILTTTTRSEVLPGFPAVELSRLASCDPAGLPACFFLHDGETADGKWRGLDPAEVDRLEIDFPERVVLVEVDGSAKQPLKIHRPGEPVWPERTSLAVVVMGASAVGGFANRTVHRLGVVPCPVLDELPAGSIIQWDHCLGLLLESQGYLAQVPEGVPAMLALAGMGEVEDSIGLFEFVGKAMQDPRLPLTLFAETEGDEPSFRTGCRVESQDQDSPAEPDDD